MTQVRRDRYPMAQEAIFEELVARLGHAADFNEKMHRIDIAQLLNKEGSEV